MRNYEGRVRDYCISNRLCKDAFSVIFKKTFLVIKENTDKCVHYTLYTVHCTL